MIDARGFLFIATAVGICAAIMAYRASKRIRISKAWPTTSGIVTQSALVRGRGPSALISYVYFAPEERYGSGLGAGGHLIADPAALVRRYPKGAKVKVRYNPSNHAESFIDSGGQVPLRSLKFLAVISIISPLLYFLWITWLR